MKYTTKVQCINLETNQIKYFDKDSIPAGFAIRQSRDMKYVQKFRTRYLKLIKYRMLNKLDAIHKDELWHYHHIKPKSIFSQNDFTVLLTVFEHCLAHYYLWKLYKHKHEKEKANKMASAFISLFNNYLRNDSYDMKSFYVAVHRLESQIDSVLKV